MIPFETLIVGAVFLALGVLIAFLVLRKRDHSADSGVGDLAALIIELRNEQVALSGRLAQISEDGQKSSAAMTKALEDRLDKVTQHMGKSLEETAIKSAKSMGELQERLKVIDEAQKNITELSGDIVSLQDILSNKQSRGQFGEQQLNDLVQNSLPPNAYDLQATLSNGKRADCLILLPNPPGPIVVDAKFPLESYRALQAADTDDEKKTAARDFTTAILFHVKAIAEKYIIEGETAESALMFLPSEAVYAELHASFPDIVEKSQRSRVWIVSPTTLMATLITIRAVLKDVRMREQAGVIQKEVGALLTDVVRLDKRVDDLARHFGQAEGDIRKIQTSTHKITRRTERISDVQLEDRNDDEGIAIEPPQVAAD